GMPRRAQYAATGSGATGGAIGAPGAAGAVDPLGVRLPPTARRASAPNPRSRTKAARRSPRGSLAAERMITASGTNPHDAHDSANWATLRLRSSARNTTRGRLTEGAGATAGSARGTPAGTSVGTPAARHGSASAPIVRALARSASTKNFAAQFGTASSMYFPHIGSDPATPPRSPGSLERITCARFTRSIA